MVSIPPPLAELSSLSPPPPPPPSSPHAKNRSSIADRLRRLGRLGKDPKPSTTPSEPDATIIANTIQTIIHSPNPYQDAQLEDSRMAALLSNPSFMNGSSVKGKPSIWSMLQNIPRPQTNPDSTTPDIIQEEEQPTYHTQLPNESSVFSDTSSIMVYSPLFPTQSDFVELAELVPFEGEEIDQERTVVNSDLDGSTDVGSAPSNSEDKQSSELRGGGTSWTLMWPFSLWYGQDQTGQPSEPTTSPVPATIRPVKSQKSIRAWVPSTSKISVQAFWWGYRLYLPPPILEILSDKTLEATKRSAVITTALTWFFNNLPIEIFPPPMKPALILLQRLVPLLGYIGTFISWSWNTIRSYDIGYGVTLTATWILPVALIPGTWFDRDFPKSPIPNSPIQLPRPLSMHSFVVPSTPTTDHDIPSSVYATPMSSVVFNSPLCEGGMSLAGSSTLRSSYAPLPTLTPSSPIHHVPPSSSSSSLYLTPDSSTPLTPTHHQLPTPTSPIPTTVPSWSSYTPKTSSSTPLTPTHRQPQLPTSPILPSWSSYSPPTPKVVPTTSSSSSLYLTPNSSTPVTPTNTQRKPQLPNSPIPTTVLPSWSSYSSPTSSSSSPINSSSSSLYLTPNSSTPIQRSSVPSTLLPTLRSTIASTPSEMKSPINNNSPSSSSSSHTTPVSIPIPPIPTELPPIPPEQPPLSPKMVNLLLRGPVLQTVPLPDVDDRSVGVDVGVGGKKKKASTWKTKKR